MKRIYIYTALLINISLMQYSMGKEFSESPFNRMHHSEIISFGGASLSSGSKTGLFRLTILKGNLPIGTNSSIPFYLSGSTFIEDQNSKSNLSNQITNTDTGVVNLGLNILNKDIRKISEFQSDEFVGPCAFNNPETGLCQFTLNTGIRVLEFKDLNKKRKNSTSIYVSGGIKLDVPISKTKKPYQRLTLSSDYTFQKFDENRLYKSLTSNKEAEFSEITKQIDIAINYSINRSWAIQLGGPIYSSEKEAERIAEFTISFRPSYR